MVIFETMKYLEIAIKWVYQWIPLIIAGIIIWGAFLILLFVPLYFYFFKPEILDTFGIKELIGIGAAWLIILGALIGEVIAKCEKKRNKEF